MSNKITDFYQAAQKQEFARNFQFRILSMPGIIKNDEQLVYLETATLPGRAIANIGVPFMGLQFNIPGTANYPGSDNWSVTFRCDAKYDIRNALIKQTRNTFDDKTSTGEYDTPNYTSTVHLQLFDKTFTKITEYSLIGAYVVSVGENAYDVGDNGSIVKVTASLAYQFWQIIES